MRIKLINSFELKFLPVRITTGLGTEYRENETEKEGQKSQTNDRHNSSFTNVPFAGCSLSC